MENPKNILVRSPNWIGDQILAYPFFHFLRETYPCARIGVACVPWVEALQFRNLVDEVFVLPNAEHRTLVSRWKALEGGAKTIREAGPWDLAICLPNSFSAAWLSFRAGARVRRGYALDGRGFILTERILWQKDPIVHRSEAYAALIPENPKAKKWARVFWGVPPENELDPATPGVLDRFDPQSAWPGVQPIDPPQGPYWILAPGSTAESRRWPIGHFRKLAERVAEETGWTGYVVGGAAEASLAEALVQEPGLKLVNYTGKGEVTSYWRFFQEAKFCVSNDSGLAHLASLCGLFVQVVWGGGNPNRTDAIGPGKVQLSMSPPECWPCERNTCSLAPERNIECLRGIDPENVWRDIKAGIRI